MKHPTREEWMAYLYGELAPPAQADLAAHLHVCPECKQTVGGWQTTMSDLQAWQLPLTSRRLAPWRVSEWLAGPLLKWGMAAMLVVGFGFGVGRLSSTASAEAAKLRATLVPVIRQQMHQEFHADLQAALATNPAGLTNEFRRQLRASLDQWTANTLAASRTEAQQLLGELVRTLQAGRQEDQSATLAALRKIDRQRRAELAKMRKDLETVAVVGDVRLQRAQQLIGELAAYTQADLAAEQTSDGVAPIHNQK